MLERVEGKVGREERRVVVCVLHKEVVVWEGTVEEVEEDVVVVVVVERERERGFDKLEEEVSKCEFNRAKSSDPRMEKWW